MSARQLNRDGSATVTEAASMAARSSSTPPPASPDRGYHVRIGDHVPYAVHREEGDVEPFESDSMAAHENANGVVCGVLTRLGVKTGQTVGFSLLFRVRDREIITVLGSQGRLVGAPVEVSGRWKSWASRTADGRDL